MTCDIQYSKELVTLKSLFSRKSELPELKMSNGRKYGHTPKLGDYIPNLYTGGGKKLKKHLIKLLNYTAVKAASHLERADLIADGVGLNEDCINDLEMAAKIPLPGLSDTYVETSLSQRKRLLDLLLTYVILFYKEEPTAALQDLRLKGPLLTGLIKLYQRLTSGNTTLPAKLIEEYLTRAIMKSEHGDGVALLKSFQNHLQFQKQLNPTYAGDEGKHRQLIYNCCATLANNDNSIVTTTSSNQSHQQSIGRHNRTRIERVNSISGENMDLIEEYCNMTTHETIPLAQAPSSRPAETRSYTNPSNYSHPAPNSNPATGSDNEGLRERNNESFQRVFMSTPCRCCGSPHHKMLKYVTAPGSTRQYTEYECPVAHYDRWADALKAQNPKSKYYISSEKFANACRKDPSKAMEAFNRYLEHGSGKHLRPQDQETLKRKILNSCNTGQNNNDPNQNNSRHRGSPPPRHERSNLVIARVLSSTTTEYKNTSFYEGRISNMENEQPPSHNYSMDVGFMSDISTPAVPDAPMHGTLHLLVATRVEPATAEDQVKFIHNDIEGNTLIDTNYPAPDDTRREFRVQLRMPDGNIHTVPYREAQGRVLPDTGSTTTLIDIKFAEKQGLIIERSPYRVALTAVNNSETITSLRCYLRLTLTTLHNEQVVIVIAAMCVPNLSHDILLGTKDLERYNIAVIPGMGEATMMIGTQPVIFPMMDDEAVTNLQTLALQGATHC